jgi:hypothetical protein
MTISLCICLHCRGVHHSSETEKCAIPDCYCQRYNRVSDRSKHVYQWGTPTQRIPMSRITEGDGLLVNFGRWDYMITNEGLPGLKIIDQTTIFPAYNKTDALVAVVTGKPYTNEVTGPKTRRWVIPTDLGKVTPLVGSFMVYTIRTV